MRLKNVPDIALTFTVLLLISSSLTVIPVESSSFVAEFFNDLAGFNAAADSPPIMITFDGLLVPEGGRDISGRTIRGVTFEAGDAPLKVVRASETYTPIDYPPGWVLHSDVPSVDYPIRDDNRLFATSGRKVLSPGGVVLAPGGVWVGDDLQPSPNPELEHDDITLILSTPAKAIGFDVLFQAADGYSFTTITLLDEGDNVIYYCSGMPMPGETEYWGYPVEGVPGGTVFAGFVSDSYNIAKVIIDDQDDDNVNPDCNIGLDTIRIRYPPMAVFGYGCFLSDDTELSGDEIIDHRCSFLLNAKATETPYVGPPGRTEFGQPPPGSKWCGKGVFIDKDYEDGPLKAILHVQTGRYVDFTYNTLILYGEAVIYINGEYCGVRDFDMLLREPKDFIFKLWLDPEYQPIWAGLPCETGQVILCPR